MLKSPEIQKIGTPLKEAWLHFATRHYRTQWKQPAPVPQSVDHDPETPILNVLNGLSHLKLSRYMQEQWEKKKLHLQEDLKTSLIERLGQRKLIGFARQMAPTEVRQYRRVDSDFWAMAQINWHDGSAYDQTSAYARVLIVCPRRHPEADFPKQKGPKIPKNEKIKEATQYFLSTEPDFAQNMTHKKRAKKIRERIKKLYPEDDVFGRGYSDDNIRKVVISCLK